MRLYKATYEIKWSNDVRTTESFLYILAPDFQTATKLAETNEKISGVLKIGGDPSSSLSKVELTAFDVIQE